MDTRVKVAFPEAGETDVSLGHKFSWAQNNWSFDAYEIFGLKQNSFLNNAIRVGYRQGDNDFFFRAENGDTRSLKKINFTTLDTYFTKFTLDYIRKINDLTKFAVEVLIL